MPSATTLKFLLLSPDYAVYSSASFSSTDTSYTAVKIDKVTSGSAYEISDEQFLSGAFQSDGFYYWVGNPSSLDSLNFAKVSGSILSTNYEEYCYTGISQSTATFNVAH